MLLSINKIQKKVDIYDIYSNIKEKTDRKREVYDLLLEKAYKKIQIGSRNDHLCCFFEIPPIVVGYPIYDINRCIAYIIKNLRESGFISKYVNQNKNIYIYICWDPNEIKDSRMLKKKKNDQHPFFINENNKKFISAKKNPVVIPVSKKIIENYNNPNIDIYNTNYNKQFSDFPNKSFSYDTMVNDNSVNFIKDNINYDQTSSLPIQLPDGLPPPIETSKKINFHPTNLKYDPNNIHLPLYGETSQQLIRYDNAKPALPIKKHPFDGISTKYNANGKIVLDLS